jgi:peptidyl-prolyl cis-trans isomerase SurA
MKTLCLLVFVYIIHPAVLYSEVVDRIIAIVGTEVITESEIAERLLFYPKQIQSERELDSLRTILLNGIIEEKLLLVQAKAETVEIDPDEVEKSLQQSLEEIRSRFPSEEALKEELEKQNTTIEGLMKRYRPKIREQLLVQKWVETKIRRVITISDLEVQRFFEENPDSIPTLPEQVSLSHILAMLLPSEKTELKIQDRLKGIFDKFEKGSSFESLAKQYSKDPATRAKGGDLGYFKRGELVKEFDDAVFKLEPGEVIPIRTRYGYHLVEILARSRDEIHARHILLPVLPSKSDTLIARKRIESVRVMALSGQDFGELARQHSDDTDTKGQGGSLGVFSLSDVNPLFRDAVIKLEVGEVTPIIESPFGFHIIKLIEHKAEKKFTFEEIKEDLRNYLLQRRMEKVYEKKIEELKKEIYVENRLKS